MYTDYHLFCSFNMFSKASLLELNTMDNCALQAVEKLAAGADSGSHSDKERQMVLNCARLLTRVLPYIFEDPDWRGFFWSSVPGAGRSQVSYSSYIDTCALHSII